MRGSTPCSDAEETPKPALPVEAGPEDSSHVPGPSLRRMRWDGPLAKKGWLHNDSGLNLYYHI
jgi:hypothetical protein